MHIGSTPHILARAIRHPCLMKTRAHLEDIKPRKQESAIGNSFRIPSRTGQSQPFGTGLVVPLAVSTMVDGTSNTTRQYL